MRCARRERGAMLAAVLLAGVALPVQAQDVGRLFTTPAERANLDELRYMARVERPEPEPEPARAAVPEVPQGPSIERLSVDGLVRPSSGPGTVWINGDLVERGGVTREGLRVELEDGGAGVRVRLPSGAGSVALKPGQQIEVGSGTVLEPWERGPSSEGVGAFEAPAADPAPPPAPADDPATGLEEAARAGLVPGSATGEAQR